MGLKCSVLLCIAPNGNFLKPFADVYVCVNSCQIMMFKLKNVHKIILNFLIPFQDIDKI